MSVKANIREGESLTRGPAGYVAVRVYDVDGLTTAGPARLVQALEASGLPTQGESHPARPELRALDFSADPEGKSIRVAVTYRRPTIEEEIGQIAAAGAVEYSSGTLRKRSFQDVNGDLMLVSYTGHVTESQAQAPNTLPQSLHNLVQADLQRPMVRATVTRTAETFPIETSTAFTGRVNSSQWSGYAAKTWRCDGIHGTPINNRDAYVVRYEFSYNPETWLFQGVALSNGIIPYDATEGNGIRSFDVYETADFNALGVSLGDG